MAARKKFSKFENKIGGVDSYNIWHTMVVVVCKIRLVCEISKVA
jgi:hypothetical protein